MNGNALYGNWMGGELQAIVLAGGLGTRLRPITYTRPKPLVPILNRPLIDHVIELLPGEVHEVFLATGYMGDTVRAHFASRSAGPKVEVVIEEHPLGTGGAIKNIENKIDGTFIVLNGDVVCSLDVGRMLAFHRSSGGIGTVALWDVEDPTSFGMVVMGGKSRIREFKEKPKKEEVVSHSVNAGTYILEPEIFSYMEPGKELSIERQVFPRALEKGLFGFGFKGFWHDAGTLANVLAIHRGLMKGVKKGDGARVAGSAELVAPVLMGTDVSIGDGSKVGPAVCIGSGVSLGGGCQLRDCVVHDHVHIGNNAVLEHCIIGEDAELGDNVQVKDGIVGDKEKVRHH